MKIFLIIGKSFSGKSYLLNKILEDKDFCKNNNLERLVEYTTRNPREGEVDGLDYNFVSNEYFETECVNNPNVVYSKYDTKYGKLYYFLDKSKLNKNKNYIGVSNTEILEKLKNNKSFKNDIKLIYLIPPNYELFSRFSERKENPNYTDNKYKEIYRRFMDDLVKFGLNSNKYVSGIQSLILVGKELYLPYVKFCINEIIIMQYKNSIISSLSGGNQEFDYHYTPSSIQSLDSVIDGKINILNGTIIIDSETEKFNIINIHNKTINNNILYI